MRAPTDYIEIFLQPGDFYFSDCNTRIRTVLGSCVSITVWHPLLCIGGMCHYMLPGRTRLNDKDLDGRYADEAMYLFLREITKLDTTPSQYQVKLFGGGNMFPDIKKPRHANVSARNIEVGKRLLTNFGFYVQKEHVGGMGHRNLIFDIWSGDVWVKHEDDLQLSTPIQTIGHL